MILLNPFMFIVQARNAITNEVVAIKKMTFSGKQSTEVCESFMRPMRLFVYFRIHLSTG